MEDFVPYELAVKLKEKGFREKCLTYYDVEDNVGLLYNTQYTDYMLPCQYTDLLQSHNTDATVTQPDDSECCVDAPTISQVLKWLREEKKIYLELVIEVDAKYMCDIYKFDVKPIKCIGSTDYFKTYELAAIAGVSYCLDNLI